MAADQGLTREELEAEGAAALPDKEVMSVLNLNTDADVGLDAAAPIDLGAGANVNAAVPIDASASANVLSHGGGSEATVDQTGAEVHQGIDGNAHAASDQTSGINQNDPALSGSSAGGAGDAPPASAGAAADTGSSAPAGAGAAADTGSSTDTSQLLDGNLLNVNTNVDLDGHVAAPVSGAVAANANVAAPINAGVAANIGSEDSTAIADAHQDPIIYQNITGDADATVNQNSDIAQGGANT